MENKFHGLPPLKRFRLMQQEQEKEKEEREGGVITSFRLPAKKRKEARNLSPPLPAAVTTPTAAAATTFCLPANRRVWALQPNSIPDKPISPFDLNVEYNPQCTDEENDPKDAKNAPKTVSESPTEKKEDDKDENEEKEDDGEEDDGIECAVCQSTDGDPSDPIVFCDGCDLMVHATCYGSPLINGVPEGDWFCTQCLLIDSQSPQIGDKNAFSCCLCPVAGGAVKPTADGRWAHIGCALLVPEVFFSDPEGREGIDCSKVPHRRWEQRCYVCKSVRGCAIDCSEPKCPFTFHVTCGLKEGLCIEYREGSKTGAIVAGFCKNHTELWKKQQETGKFKIVARDEHKK
ncbi:hypothetical protein U1Q18_024360 [Sarracenia purpurea var. burkii]